MRKSSVTSSVGFTSSGKDLKPYWNAACKAISSLLWLPTAIDSHSSDLTSSKDWLNVTVDKSWFSANLFTPAHPTNWYTTYIQSLTSLLPECLDSVRTVTKSKKIRLYPTAGQKAIFRRWLGTYRYVYNQTLAYLKTLEGVRPSWMEIAKNVIQPQLPAWAREIPYQIKKIAVKEACEAFTAVKVKFKRTGELSKLSFKSRKSLVQTCYIPKSAVSSTGIYYTLSGVLKYAEALPVEFQDCELSYQQGRWFLCVPYQTTSTSGENQVRIVALDPGVRTFQTFFSPDAAGALGYHDFGRIVRLCRYLDDLISRYTTSKTKKQRYRMRKAADRMRWKIRDLRNELHAKSARFLVDHFDILLIPAFETAQMAKRENRKLRSKTVRALLTWAHFQFKQRLKFVALQAGKTVIEVREDYTSKTCSWSGEIVKVGSSESIRGSDHIRMHRDMNGARGIFLRALVELPLLDSLQHAVANNANDS